MSWISDVSSELGRLKSTPKEMRKFAYLVGSVLILIGSAGFLKHWHFFAILGILLCALILLCSGLLNPKVLRRVYVVWMGIAFALGWIVSRAILILLFYLVITPIGVTARLFGKKFVDIDFTKAGESYWVSRENSRKINYEKMF